MAFPIIPVALGAAALGALYLLSGSKAPALGSGPAVPPPQPLPPGKPVEVPFNPAAPLAQPAFDRPKGVSEPVFLTYDPYRPSFIQQAQALRYLEIANLFPFEMSGADDPVFVESVANFQDWAKLPRSGKVDTTTQTAIHQAVAAKNAVLHNKNVSQGLPDVDWIQEQNKLGAADPRGAWKVGAVARAAQQLDDYSIDRMQASRY